MQINRFAFSAFPVVLCLSLALSAHALTAAEYRKLADQAVAKRDYAKAVEHYKAEAAVYRQKGDVNAAIIEEGKAERWNTDLRLYREQPADATRLATNTTNAKHEPLYGCYLGIYLEQDERLLWQVDANRKPLTPEAAFRAKFGKGLSTEFTYCHYGERFPIEWADRLWEQQVIPHIAWEPSKLRDVQDNAYLRSFAKEIALFGGPVFIRFACEANGAWTPYHGDPKLYQQKFKLVHDVLAKDAPNAAMIWCVGNMPEQYIDAYYPGDDAVDWVGVNCYSVYYHDNSRARPAAFENPASFLAYVYNKYSARKPIAVCEYGATHFDSVDRQERSDFAATKLAQMYAALPRLYPRVKMINIFDCNNLENAPAGRQLNNYCITDSPAVLAALQQAIAPDYFLAGAPAKETPLPTHIAPLATGDTLTGTISLSAWVKTYEDAPTLVYYLDGKEFARAQAPGPCAVTLVTTQYAAGAHTLMAVTLDSKASRAGRVAYAVTFANEAK